MPDDLSEEVLTSLLVGRFGRPLRIVDETGSTNSDALAWAAAGAPEGAVIVADQQTGGRGRRGRSWLSAPGSSLLFSVVLHPDLPLDRSGLLATALGLACAEGIEAAGGPPTRIKWPNDVTVAGLKIAGVLIETRVVGASIEAAVAGAGINVHMGRSELPKEIRATATSIAQESGPGVVARDRLLAAILGALEPRYEEVLAGDPRLVEDAAARSEVLGRRVGVRFADGRRVEGVALRLLDDGALELRSPAGVVAFTAGEIELLRPLPD